MMQTRKLGPFKVSTIGLGCMSLSHAYGTPPEFEDASALLLRALDLGYTHVDTAALYGFGGGMYGNAKGHREIDGRPEMIRRNCEDSLTRLQTDVIDLYYLHRWDKRVPIEESIGALADLVKEGKVKTIGMSEVSATAIRKAHRVHKITAVQTEYSLWTRNAEVAVLDTCRDLGITFVGFSPLARGFLTGTLRDTSTMPPKDIRLGMPRFQPEHFPKNLLLLDGLATLASQQGCTMGQLALAWVLAQGPHIVPIPGTTRLDHLEENVGATNITLSHDMQRRLDALINPTTVSGPRYAAAVQAEIDTEELGARTV